MEQLYFFIAILACADEPGHCCEARLLPARYETAAECRAALPERLKENTDIAAPTIEADCRLTPPQGPPPGTRHPRG